MIEMSDSVLESGSAAPPKPIDPRGPRFNQGVITVALLAAFLADWKPMVPVIGVVLLLSAAGGSQWGPFLRLYRDAIRPRLSPPGGLEDPRGPQFAATIGTVFLAGSTIAHLAGAAALGWGLALVVAALAGLAAVTGICVGCEIWLFFARRRGVPLAV